MSLSLEALNKLDQAQFVQAIGWVFEHSPWVAERAWRHRPFASVTELLEQMAGEVAAAGLDEQLALLRAHPDLGTRAKVSPDSASEQAGVGLDRLNPEEYARLVELNSAYKDRFGFPFLYAVKGSNKSEILAALEQRLGSSREDEFQEALRQVGRIARFRLEGTIQS